MIRKNEWIFTARAINNVDTIIRCHNVLKDCTHYVYAVRNPWKPVQEALETWAKGPEHWLCSPDPEVNQKEAAAEWRTYRGSTT